MEIAANNAGIHFDFLFFDEVLDGLSSGLKLKALGLFQELELRHNTVIVTDHATELFDRFDNRFNVTLKDDRSTIVKV
jgi:DNA repair exonuclease SbcCD ATPase subunit